MIVVSGTKRSGTSMWMQILKAGGLEIYGESFMKGWDKTIKDANPHGFYESEFRRGVNFRTNPDPKTLRYVTPDETRDTVVKIFARNVVKTECAYLNRVLLTVRHWREYETSLDRLFGMEAQSRKDLGKPAPRPQVRLPGWLDWWEENYLLLRDVTLRRYPLLIVAYDTTLTEPDKTVRRVMKWLGQGDAESALLAVDTGVRTQIRETGDLPKGMKPEWAEVFDEYYERVFRGRELDVPFVEKMNQVHLELMPIYAAFGVKSKIVAARQTLADAARARAASAEAASRRAQQATGDLNATTNPVAPASASGADSESATPAAEVSSESTSEQNHET